MTVNYQTVAGSASAGSDFVAKSGSLTFSPGQALSQTVPVVVNGDVINEPNETFTLQLSGAVGGVVGDSSGQATIVDPSAPPSLTISDAVVNEGAGTVALDVTLAGTTAQTVTVQYEGQSGPNFPSATLGTDFTLTAGTLSFAPGETKKTITVGIVNDTVAEADETFRVVLKSPAPAGVTLAKSTSTVKIVDNDPTPGGGGGNPSANPPPAPPGANPPASPPPPAVKPAVVKVKLLTARVLWIKLDGKVQGRKRAAIRVTLNQKVAARLLMIQGKRTVRSGQFELKAGNRTVYVLLPKNVKKGRVNFQLLFTTASASKVLKTNLVLKA